MYKSINVHIENGIVVLDEPLPVKGNVKGILTIIEEVKFEKTKSSPNGKKLAKIFQNISESNHSFSFIDPIVWQREIRKDRNLEDRN